MDQALERQKGHEDEATAAFNQVFQACHKIFKLVYLQQQLKTKSKQANSCKLFVLMDLIVRLKYSAISVRDMFITQSLRKTLTNLELALPNTHQMSLSTMSKLKQNKIGGAFFRFLLNSSTICLIIFLPHLVSHGQIYIKKLFKIVGMEFLLFSSSREIEVKAVVTDTNFFFTVINFQFV